MPSDAEILKRIYNIFDPASPLAADSEVYVDCQEVRGDRNINLEVGTEIVRSDAPTCQLYTGHRGAGKSTELLRLQKYLETEGYKVVYFSADEEDIDPEDARYTDILLACTRRLVQAIGAEWPDNPVMKWLKSRWGSLKELANSEVEVDKITLDVFVKITANLRAVPSLREEIRKQIEPHTVNLLEALNKLIVEAKEKMPEHAGIVLIVDNLDRIVFVTDPNTKRSNHEEIFLDRSEQLKALKCHVVYTVPISMLYSQSGIHLDSYGTVEVLPMIKVCEYESGARVLSVRTPHQPGVDTLKRLIEKRIKQAGQSLTLEAVFEDIDILDKLCLMSGGHIRNLVLLLRTSMIRTQSLPIPKKAMLRALSEMQETYRRTIADEEWDKLAKVYCEQKMPNKDEYRQLLFNRCILEYREVDEAEKVKTWCNVHPLIEDMEEFKKAYAAHEQAVSTATNP